MAMKRSRSGTQKRITRNGEISEEDDETTTTTTTTTTRELGLGSKDGLLNILELPILIIFQILSRLPLKTIFRCRCVCKIFLKLLTDPYFARLHLTTSPTTTAPTLITHEYSSTRYGHLSLVDHDETTPSSYKTAFGFPMDKVGLVGSCNGLLCLHHHSSCLPFYYICNPILGECMILPPPPFRTDLDSTYLNGSAFGFSPNTNQYKIIRFVTNSEDTLKKTIIQIYTVGSQMWRTIGDAPSPRPARLSFDPYLNGALHWVTDSRTSSNLIYSFDIDKERFVPVPLPAHFDPGDYVSKVTWINVGSSGGCLCICYVYGGARFEVWVMKDYGVKESWTKKFAIDDINFYCGLRVGNEHLPIRFLNNGDMLLICNSRSLVSYSPRKGSFKDLKNYGIGSKIEAIAHTSSFVSLRDVVMEKRLYVHVVRVGETFML